MKDLVKQCAEKDRVIDESRETEKQWQQEKEELQRALGRKECLEAARNLVPSDMTPPAGQQANPPPRQRAPPPPRRNDGGCFNCGQPDHGARNCPQNDRRQRDARPPRDQQVQREGNGAAADSRPIQNNRAVAPGRSHATSAYLKVIVDNWPLQYLIDSGSEASIFPSKYVRQS